VTHRRKTLQKAAERLFLRISRHGVVDRTRIVEAQASKGERTGLRRKHTRFNASFKRLLNRDAESTVRPGSLAAQTSGGVPDTGR
jgi:hypothetical protein